MNAQRERILRAAIQCMGELGLERTSVAAICRAARLSTGALYRHFDGKESIVAEALRFAAMDEATVPDSWPDLREGLSRLEDERGFEVDLIARTNLQLLASSLRPGPLRAMLKPMMEGTLAFLADRLATMETAGQIRLRMSPQRTAMCITALADGLTWVGLASGRTRAEIAGDVAAGLDCLVEVAT